MTRSNVTQLRERRVIVGGVIVVIVALLAAYVVRPVARQWSDREHEITQSRARVDSLAGLAAAQSSLETAASRAESDLAGRGTRVFHARSLTLAASALQTLVQNAADASHLVVSRLDVAPNVGTRTLAAGAAQMADSSSASSPSLPATLAAYGDIVGLAALLDNLARSPRVVRIDKLTVQQNSALRGAPDMLQITITLHAPVVIE